VINLSTSPQTVNFSVSTENDEILTIVNQPEQVIIPPQSKMRINSFSTCKGTFLDSLKNVGYIKITSSINGIAQDREHILQVTVKNKNPQLVSSEIKIFDGKSENLPLFKYDWREWDNPITTGIISEGSGNGNGKAEIGETFSIWIQVPEGFDSKDNSTWHPVVPINKNDNRDISLVQILHHKFNTGRDVLSAQIRINRIPTKENPIRIPIQTELLKVQHLENDCHRNTSDNFKYAFGELVLNEDGTIEVEDTQRKNN
jgi:hypothetical protein